MKLNTFQRTGFKKENLFYYCNCIENVFTQTQLETNKSKTKTAKIEFENNFEAKVENFQFTKWNQFTFPKKIITFQFSTIALFSYLAIIALFLLRHFSNM